MTREAASLFLPFVADTARLGQKSAAHLQIHFADRAQPDIHPSRMGFHALRWAHTTSPATSVERLPPVSPYPRSTKRFRACQGWWGSGYAVRLVPLHDTDEYLKIRIFVCHVSAICPGQDSRKRAEREV